MSDLLIRQDRVKSCWWQVSSRISIIQDGSEMDTVSVLAVRRGTYTSLRWENRTMGKHDMLFQ